MGENEVTEAAAIALASDISTDDMPRPVADDVLQLQAAADTLARICQRLIQIQAASGWRSIADSPPPGRCYILAAGPNGDGGWCRQTAVYFPDGEVRDAYGNRIKPTHWMPLPEPPNGR